MRDAILTYFNHQIDPAIAENQALVVNKMIAGKNVFFQPLFYNAKDGDVYPDQVINYALNQLFYVHDYDNVLILDIDCIPLGPQVIDYVFYRAAEGYLIGNAQRSHYIENDEHIFIGSSCLCLSRNTFERLGKPDFGPTKRGDIAEELTYRAEECGSPIEFFIPHDYEASPYGVENWALKGDLKPYGIGTTFMRTDGVHMFYHLFESRTNLNVERFVAKVAEVLNRE
jgi:hypothetical protein